MSVGSCSWSTCNASGTGRPSYVLVKRLQSRSVLLKPYCMLSVADHSGVPYILILVDVVRRPLRLSRTAVGVAQRGNPAACCEPHRTASPRHVPRRMTVSLG
eukprot:1167948-Prymnesium_polylepis.1